MKTPRIPALTRRTFLKGAGVALALPALEALAPRHALAQAPAIRRFVAWYVPNGIHMEAYRPSREGLQWPTPPILTPLHDLRQHLTIISGLRNDPAFVEGGGGHATGTASYLTCMPIHATEGADIKNGVSIDQVLARQLSPAVGGTPLPSLQLGAQGGDSVGDCDNGFSCAYARNISWTSETTPLPKEVRPAAVFDRLFSGASPGLSAEARARRKAMRLSVIDQVSGQTSGLMKTLGGGDRARLDEYLTGLRELERRIESASSELPAGCEPMPRPGTAADVPELVRQMTELTVLALRCDLTRVVSFMLGNAASQRVYRHLGMDSGHHELSHHQGNPTKHAALQVIGTWEMELLAHLIRRLAEVQDVDGSPLIDSTAVLWSSEISDGDKHNHDDLPVIVAGGGLGGGRHVVATGRPLADLYLGIAASLGVSLDRFGDDGRWPLEL